MLVKTTDGTPDAVKVARPVWSGGKSGDNFKGLPITINLVTPHLPVLSCVHVLASQNQGIMGNIHNDFLLKHVAGRALHVDGGNGFICFSAHKFYLLSVIVVRWLQNQTVSFTHPQYTREGA